MRPKGVRFGDSIIEESFGDGGWGAALANHFSRTADGCCDATTVTTLAANDASLAERSSGFEHVPLNEYQSNLRSIIFFFKELWQKTFINRLMQGPSLKGNQKMAAGIYEKVEGNRSRISQAAAFGHCQRKK